MFLQYWRFKTMPSSLFAEERDKDVLPILSHNLHPGHRLFGALTEILNQEPFALHANILQDTAVTKFCQITHGLQQDESPIGESGQNADCFRRQALSHMLQVTKDFRLKKSNEITASEASLRELYSHRPRTKRKVKERSQSDLRVTSCS